MTDRVTTSREGAVAKITLNRPEALNALENSMIAALVAAIREAGSDPDTRVILIEGAGKAFCAGDDLKDMGTAEHPRSDDLLEEYERGYPAIVKALRDVEKPTLCAVQRYALGAGFEIALACDLIVAERDAKFGLPFALRGIAAGTAVLPRLVGRHRAARLLFLGEMIDAETACEWGLVAVLADPGKLAEAVEGVVGPLATAATRAIGLMKGAMVASAEATLAADLRTQAASTVSSALTRDFAEGAEAFTQKRDPQYTGR